MLLSPAEIGACLGPDTCSFLPANPFSIRSIHGLLDTPSMLDAIESQRAEGIKDKPHTLGLIHEMLKQDLFGLQH